METIPTVELVVSYPSKRKASAVSVHYPLTSTQVSLLQRAAEFGLPSVPGNLQDELRIAVDHLARVGMVSL